MKQKLASESEQELYDLGYEDSTSDHFVPMLVIALACAVGGCVLGMCL